MKAITTKYYGATNTRGSRIVARDRDNNRISIPYPHELSGEACHAKAAMALCRKMGWDGVMFGGSTADGYAFVFDGGPRWAMDDDGNLYDMDARLRA